MPAVGVIPAIIGAAGSIGGAAIAAHAAGSAADQQVAASNQALQQENQIYQQQRADLAPWRTAGAGALGLLSQGLGLPSGGAIGGGGAANPLAGLPPGTQTNIPGLPPSAVNVPLTPENAQDRALAPGTMLQPGQAGVSQGGGPVWLKAPDGTVKAVPENLASSYIQAGATRL